jgi:hypothetical protein
MRPLDFLGRVKVKLGLVIVLAVGWPSSSTRSVSAAD